MRAFLLTLALGLLAAPAAAQDTPRCHQVRPGLLRCDEIVVEGRGPAGFVLLPRSRFEWEPPPLRREATREVPRTVRREPF